MLPKFASCFATPGSMVWYGLEWYGIVWYGYHKDRLRGPQQPPAPGQISDIYVVEPVLVLL